MEAIRIGHRNWQPDDVEEEVEQDDPGGQTEYPLVSLRIEVVHPDSDKQETLGYNPLDSPEIDVVNIG